MTIGVFGGLAVPSDEDTGPEAFCMGIVCMITPNDV